MQRLYCSDDWLLLNHLRNLLEMQGIQVWLRHALMGGAGDLPLTETWPELWLIEDGQLEQARAILQRALVTETDGADARATDGWRCTFCGESIEAQFDHCWRCGGPSGRDE